VDLTAFGIAAIIGAGIFSTIGNAAFNGGPAVAFLFVFTAIACAFSALCYAEFASRVPISGSAYTYAYASFGELVAWIIGWDLLVEYAIGNIAVAISWSDYFTGLLASLRIPALGIDGIVLPAWTTMDYLSASRGYQTIVDTLGAGATLEAVKANADLSKLADAFSAWTASPHIAGLRLIADLPALAIVALVTFLVYVGIRESKRASNAMVAFKLLIIFVVITVGAFYINPENWHPFAPNGVSGVLKGVSAVFFAYIGFDAITTTAEECRNPKRDLPLGMFLSLAICTVLYIAIALVLTGMVSHEKLAVGDPLAFVFGPDGANLPWLRAVVAISAVVAMTTVLLVFQLGQPRIWMSMSRDGLLPPIFSAIHPRFKTPWFATLMTGLLVAVPALFMNLTEGHGPDEHRHAVRVRAGVGRRVVARRRRARGPVYAVRLVALDRACRLPRRMGLRPRLPARRVHALVGVHRSRRSHHPRLGGLQAPDSAHRVYRRRRSICRRVFRQTAVAHSCPWRAVLRVPDDGAWHYQLDSLPGLAGDRIVPVLHVRIAPQQVGEDESTKLQITNNK
jgi:amino acid transporter